MLECVYGKQDAEYLPVTTGKANSPTRVLFPNKIEVGLFLSRKELRMSIKIMSAVWERAPVDGGSLLVLLAMADFANDNGICWPSVPSLARKSRLSERQVQRVLRDLEDSKLIMTDLGTGPHGVNTYKVLARGDKMSPSKPQQGVTFDAEGVTFATPRGDMGDTQTVIEPSLIEPSSGIEKSSFLERRYADGKRVN